MRFRHRCSTVYTDLGPVRWNWSRARDHSRGCTSMTLDKIVTCGKPNDCAGKPSSPNRSPIRPFSRKKEAETEASEEKKKAKRRRIKRAGSLRVGSEAIADSSNRVHILNAGCSEHSAAAYPPAVRFERLRRYIRNDLPSSVVSSSVSPCVLPPSCLQRWSLAFLFFFSFRGVRALSNRCPRNFISTPRMVNGPHRRT